MTAKLYMIKSAQYAEILNDNKKIIFDRTPKEGSKGCCLFTGDKELQEEIEKRKDFGKYIILAETISSNETEEEVKPMGKNSVGSKISNEDTVTSTAKAKAFMLALDVSEEEKTTIASLKTVEEVKAFGITKGFHFPNWK